MYVFSGTPTTAVGGTTQGGEHTRGRRTDASVYVNAQRSPRAPPYQAATLTQSRARTFHAARLHRLA